MAAVSARTGPSLLGIYLNDHLAGATAGTELARRMAASGHLPVPVRALPRLASEIGEDREALLEMMAALGVLARSYKVYASWIGEGRPAKAQRPPAVPLTAEQPGGAGNAPARSRGQGRRLAHAAGAGRPGHSACGRTARRADHPRPPSG